MSSQFHVDRVLTDKKIIRLKTILPSLHCHFAWCYSLEGTAVLAHVANFGFMTNPLCDFWSKFCLKYSKLQSLLDSAAS